MAAGRKSDRWVTPGVVIAGILTAGLVIAIVAAGVTYLAARGVDPDPMLRLVAEVGTLMASAGALILQLVNRTTTTKVERNTGQLVGVVSDVVDVVSAPPAPARVDEHLADDYGAALDRAVNAKRPGTPSNPWPADDPRPYVVDLDDEPTAHAVTIPPLPDYPRHARRRSDR